MTDAEKLAKIAENQQKVYDAGKQAQYDEFWDTLQKNGTLTDYRGVFAGTSWTPELFNPKYPIKPTNAYNMFSWFCRSGVGSNLDKLIDLSQFNIDFSECKFFTCAFQNARIKNTGFIDFSNAGTLDRVFDGSDWGLIQKIHLKVVETNKYSAPFTYCYNTEEIIFSNDSVIANNGINLQWSTKLSKESIESVVNALSTTTSGLTVTISKTAKENAFTDEEWATLIATKQNWTINLI